MEDIYEQKRLRINAQAKKYRDNNKEKLAEARRLKIKSMATSDLRKGPNLLTLDQDKSVSKST